MNFRRSHRVSLFENDFIRGFLKVLAKNFFKFGPNQIFVDAMELPNDGTGIYPPLLQSGNRFE